MVLGERIEILGKVSEAAQLGAISLGTRSDISVNWNLRCKDFMASIKTIDYFLTRKDGVGVIDSRGIMTTDDGEKIGVKLGGYALQAESGKIKLKGFMTFETASVKYQNFNSIIDIFEGEMIVDKGEIVLNAYEWKEV